MGWWPWNLFESYHRSSWRHWLPTDHFCCHGSARGDDIDQVIGVPRHVRLHLQEAILCHNLDYSALLGYSGPIFAAEVANGALYSEPVHDIEEEYRRCNVVINEIK